MNRTLSRRRMLRTTGAAAVLALFQRPLTAFGFQDVGEGELIPFLDAQPVNPKRPMLEWQKLDRWITPNDQIFAVSHYGTPTVDEKTWALEIGGLVKHPKKLTLDEIRQRPKHSVIATLECSGNSSSSGFLGAIGNTKWTGTPLKALLDECAPYKRAIETVFYGADEKVEKIRDKEYPQNFARSLALADATRGDGDGDVLLCYEMNGEPLTTPHGAPVRLVVPGRFGIDWIKWLSRIELLDRRFMGKYQAREYVTIRGEERPDGKTIWRETSVGPIDVKSIVARAVRSKDGAVRLSGAAWTDGTPLERVEVQIDDGDWQPAQLQPKPEKAPYAWTFFTFDWKSPKEGEHTIVSRATDAEGRVQPKPDDAEIRLKRTYWEANQQYPRRIKL